ncbi:MAG: ArsR/SmtB family transcription factor [Bacilli bacterium]
MYDGTMDAYPDILTIGKLIGDPARAAMLVALLDGDPRPASDLAWLAHVSRQAASAHLSKLVAGGLLDVFTSGRYRYYRLKNAQVATALEMFASIAPQASVRSLRTSEELNALRTARICYDHLAGHVGVRLTAAFLAKQWLVDQGPQYGVTDRGVEGFRTLGIAVEEVRRARRVLAYPCMDWSESRSHLAGSLGAVVFKMLLDCGWVERMPTKRAVQLTDTGRSALAHLLDMEWNDHPQSQTEQE